jgi:SAM-dependent methyltransferase
MTDESPYLSFDRYAGIYDQTRIASPVVASAIAEAMVDTVRIDRRGTILDAGVGTGRYAAPLAHRFPGRVVGVDISWPMLRRIPDKPHGAGVRRVRGDLRRLPLRDGAIRAALAIHIFHLIEDWRGAVDEIRRVLEPGGVLLMGAEGGGRSLLDDYYLEAARASGHTRPTVGARGLEHALGELRLLPIPPRVERLHSATRRFRRRRSVRETLDALDHRPYSELRALPDDLHRDLMARTRAHAADQFPSLDTIESRETRFTLYAVRW